MTTTNIFTTFGDKIFLQLSVQIIISLDSILFRPYIYWSPIHEKPLYFVPLPLQYLVLLAYSSSKCAKNFAHHIHVIYDKKLILTIKITSPL